MKALIRFQAHKVRMTNNYPEVLWLIPVCGCLIESL